MASLAAARTLPADLEEGLEGVEGARGRRAGHAPEPQGGKGGHAGHPECKTMDHDGRLPALDAGLSHRLRNRPGRFEPTRQHWNTNSNLASGAASRKRVLGFVGMARDVSCPVIPDGCLGLPTLARLSRAPR